VAIVIELEIIAKAILPALRASACSRALDVR
jgi:hypothetical protein